MTVAISMETEARTYLVHGKDLGLAIRKLLDQIEVIHIQVADEDNMLDSIMAGLVEDSVIEFKKNREAAKSKQQENV